MHESGLPASVAVHASLAGGVSQLPTTCLRRRRADVGRVMMDMLELPVEYGLTH